MDGMRLLKVINQSAYTLVRDLAMVERIPAVKYKINKVNSFDPTLTIRRMPYFEDQFQIDDIMTPGDYTNFIEFINDEADYYIEYNHNGLSYRYPIKVDKLPKCPDDLRDFIAKSEYSFISRYASLIANSVTATISEPVESYA